MNVGELYRREYGRILATLIRSVGSFDLAEDALQDAFEAALSQWPGKGPPQNPLAWLITTARHKAIDRIRHRAMAEGKHEEIAAIAMADGVEQGLALLDRIHLPGYHLLPSARAHFLRQLGRNVEAAAAYRQALALVTNDAERRFLERRLAEVTRPQQ